MNSRARLSGFRSEALQLLIGNLGKLFCLFGPHLPPHRVVMRTQKVSKCKGLEMCLAFRKYCATYHVRSLKQSVLFALKYTLPSIPCKNLSIYSKSKWNQKSMNWWMWYVCAMEYYSVIKRNEVLIHVKTWTWKTYAKWNKTDMKDHISYHSVYTKCPEEVNPWRRKSRLVVVRG